MGKPTRSTKLLKRRKSIKSSVLSKMKRKTKGGNYPIYKKGSAKGKSFNSALSAARKRKAKTFTWDGRSYNTNVKKKTRRGATYTSKVGRGSKLGNMARRMKANRAQRKTNRKKK